MSNPQKSSSLAQIQESTSKQKMVLEETGSLLNYSYTSSGLANDPLQELHYRFLGLLFQFTMISLLLYASVIALSFISASTVQYGSPPHCKMPDLIFNGWQYSLVCTECESGFFPSNGTVLCLSV